MPRDFVNPNDNNDRGLIFLSYQSSIKEQFEFLTTEWMNNPKKPTNPEIPGSNESGLGGGHDLILGQTNENNNRIRYGTLSRKVDNKTVIEVITTGSKGIFDWVIPTGGGYFFAPSLSTLTYIAEN